MAQQLFRRVGRLRRGYDPRAVDEFFATAQRIYEDTSEGELTGADVRTVSFDLVHHGYACTPVDQALDRLDAAFSLRAKAARIDEVGQGAWNAYIAEHAKTLYGHLARPAGKRFSAPRRGLGYDRAEVDHVCDRLVAFFNSGKRIGPAEVRGAVFTQRRKSRSYAMAPVDAFLDRALDVLLAVQ